MAVTIGSNISAMQVMRQLSAASTRVASASERLASGMRINKASDDAAGLSIVSTLNASAKVYAQAARNVNDTLSLTAISEAALGQLSAITMRQRELATQAANGVYSTNQRGAMDTEARALTNEYNRIIQTTKFNGVQVLANPWDQLQTQAGIGAAAILSTKFADELSTKVTPGSSFTIDAAGNKYYVWFAVDGVGTDPHTSETGLRVDLYSSAVAGTPVPATQGTASAYFGTATDHANDVMYISSPTSKYYIWFNVDGGGIDPLDPDALGATRLTVDLNSWDDDVAVTAAVAAKLASTGQFTVQNNGNSIDITNVTAGQSQFGAYGYFSISGDLYQTSMGADATTVGGHSRVMEASEIRDAVATKLTSTGNFSTSLNSDGSLIVTDTIAGRVVDAKDINSGILLVDPLSNGTGRSYYGMGSFSSDLQLADFNGDGNIDAVTADAFAGTFSVRLGQGDGSFGTRTAYTNFGGIYNLQVADINKDGKLDLLGVGASNVATILIGNGDGSFAARTSVALGTTANHAVRARDMNGDGNLDLVAVTTSGVTIALGNGNNTFGGATSYSMYTNAWHGMEVGDLNRDGKMDVIVTNANASGSVSVRLGNGDGTLGAVVSYAVGNAPTWVALGDINGDGIQDMAATNNTSNDLSVRLGVGDGTFGTLATYATGAGPRNVVLTDLNGDGRSDVLYASPGSSIASIRFANSDGTFGSTTNYSNGSATSGIGVADLNGDGIKDLVTSDYNSNTLSVRQGTAPGIFEASNNPGRMRLIFGDGRGMTMVNQIDLRTAAKARAALDTLDARLTRINSQAGAYGSHQARLNVALANLKVARENFLAAESRIKDVDIADESANHTRASILQQVGSSVLASANLRPQVALDLLRNI